MSTTVRRATEITVGLPPEQALALFMPEGERLWADGWNPRYPGPRRREGAGAVFTTDDGGDQTTWIMVDHGAGTARYARVDGMTAGTVAVDVLESRGPSTQLRVTYDLTALTQAGDTWLDALDADYDEEIGDWAAAIAGRTQTRRRTRRLTPPPSLGRYLPPSQVCLRGEAGVVADDRIRLPDRAWPASAMATNESRS